MDGPQACTRGFARHGPVGYAGFGLRLSGFREIYYRNLDACSRTLEAGPGLLPASAKSDGMPDKRRDSRQLQNRVSPVLHLYLLWNFDSLASLD